MKVIKWLDENFEEVILVIFLVLITIVMTIQIVARSLGSPLTWSEEAARFLFVWSGFFSISYCVQKQISLKIDQLVEMLPGKAAIAVKLLEKLIMLAFFLYMISFGYDYFIRGIQSGQLSPAMQLPMAAIQVAPLVGFILTSIRLIQNIIRMVMGLTKTPSTEMQGES